MLHLPWEPSGPLVTVEWGPAVALTPQAQRPWGVQEVKGGVQAQVPPQLWALDSAATPALENLPASAQRDQRAPGPTPATQRRRRRWDRRRWVQPNRPGLGSPGLGSTQGWR